MPEEWSQMFYYGERLRAHIEYRDWQLAECYIIKTLDGVEQHGSDEYAAVALHVATAAAELMEHQDYRARCYRALGYEELPEVDLIPQEVIQVMIDKAIGYMSRLRPDPTSRLGKIHVRVLNLLVA